MIDKAFLLLVMPFVVWLLIIGWLVYATTGERSIRLSVRGLGLSINIDTDPGPLHPTSKEIT